MGVKVLDREADTLTVQLDMSIQSPVKGAYYEATLQKAKSLRSDQVRIFLSQWYAFSNFVPEILSLYAWRAENETERSNIIQNLYSELGLDNGGVSHPRMLHDLIEKATGSGPDQCHMNLSTQEFIANLRDAVINGSAAYNSGLFRGLEHVAYDILDVLKEILTKSGKMQLVAHPYITIHEKIEADHIHKTEENIELHADSRGEVEAGFRFVMNQWEVFWKSAYLGLIG